MRHHKRETDIERVDQILRHECTLKKMRREWITEAPSQCIFWTIGSLEISDKAESSWVISMIRSSHLKELILVINGNFLHHYLKVDPSVGRYQLEHTLS